MTRHVFFSFHYDEDNQRTQQIRNIRNPNWQKIAYGNKWESIRRESDIAIKRWINGELKGCSCVVVLIGSHTASREWIRYEICEAWNEGKGVFGIYIHGLKDLDGNISRKGKNPFENVQLSDGRCLSSMVPAYDLTVIGDSKATYGKIANNMESWIENAIRVRKQYP